VSSPLHHAVFGWTRLGLELTICRIEGELAITPCSLWLDPIRARTHDLLY
jgi:hypothetical protein